MGRQTVRCIDCIAEGVTTMRPTPHGGPRSPLCATHNRARKRRTRTRKHEQHVERHYGITAIEYQAIYRAQDGRCAICGKSKGVSKRLAVDHEHNKPGCEHPPEVGCRNCVRCLACTTCNKVVLGRYSVAALQRAIDVLTCPPAQQILNSTKRTVHHGHKRES